MVNSGPPSIGRREHREETSPKHVEWVKLWGWQMYTPCMGTGAVAVCLSSIPYKFRGQHALGTIFFLLDLSFFIINLTMTILRAKRYPKIFQHSFYDVKEGIMFPMALLSFATVLIGIILYGIPYSGDWLIRTCEALYWIYAALSAIGALITQNTLRLLPRPLKVAGPSEALEVFPIMLCGSIGGILVPHLMTLSHQRALTMLIFSYVMQGLGFFMGILKMSVWMVHHVLLARAPASTLPSYIIALGPPSFTALAVINLGLAAVTLFPEVNFLSGLGESAPDPKLVGQVFLIVGIWWGFLMCGVGTWILLIHVGWSVLSGFQMLRHGFVDRYDMSWWSWTFPLSGLVSTLGKFATLIPSKGFGVLNIIGTTFVACMWLLNILGTGQLLRKGILPGAPIEYDATEIAEEIESDRIDAALYEAGGSNTLEKRRVASDGKVPIGVSS